MSASVASVMTEIFRWPCCQHCTCNPVTNDHTIPCAICQKRHRDL